MWLEQYSIERQGLTVFLHPILGAVFSVLGIYLLVHVIRSKNKDEKEGCTMTFFSLWTAFAWLWTIGVTYDIYVKYHYLESALTENRYQVVEGTVGEVKTWMTKRGETEKFTVDTVTFQYCHGGVNPGFNTTQSYGSPIAFGRQVKIYYFKGVILKLWIKEAEK